MPFRRIGEVASRFILVDAAEPDRKLFAAQTDSRMLYTPSVAVAILVILVVVGWFAIGTQVNVRRGDKALGWLRQGMKIVGEKATLRWLGSSVLELKVQEANQPFRSAEVLAVFEPRDVSVLWWYHHARGRRDLLMVRAQLRQTPGFELEALDPSGWSTRGVEQQVRFRNWDPVAYGGGALGNNDPNASAADNKVAACLRVYTAGRAPQVTALIQEISPPECPIVRLAVRRAAPNLEVHWRLADAQKISAQDLFERVQRMAQRLGP